MAARELIAARSDGSGVTAVRGVAGATRHRTARRVGGVALVAGAVAGCVMMWIIVDHGGAFALARGTFAVAVEVGAAVALIVAGVIALVRRRPFALLVLGVGAAWTMREWANPAAPNALVFTLGLLLGTIWLPLTGWLALAYSRGLPERGRDRVAVALAVAAVLAPAFLRAVTLDPQSSGCLACPANLALIVDSPSVARSAGDAGAVLGLTSSLMLIGFLADRFLRASPADRLLISLVAGTSAISIGLAAIGFAAIASMGLAAAPVSRTLSGGVAVALIGVAVAVSWEIVRAAAARRRSARLVSDLSRAPGPGRLRDALAAITHDESLEISYPLADRVVDAVGRAIPDPRASGEDRMRRATVAVGADGAALAVLTHRPGLLDDDGFRDAVARAASLALEHERLQAELASRVSDLQGSRARLVTSFDSERRRLERDLHDGAQQQVVALLLKLRLALARHPDPELVWAIAEVGLALDELRELAHGLYPAALAEDGLGAALEVLREGADIPIRISGAPGRRLSSAVETTAYVVVAETLRARRLRSAVVDVTEAGGVLSVTVSGPPDGPEAFAGFGDGVGGLGDRVGAIGGGLRVDVVADALTVQAELPCE